MARNPRRPRVTSCLGGGGAFGIGMHFGVARALSESGVNIAAAPSIGTSAGAWAGAALALDIDLETVMEPWRQTSAKRFGHRSVDTVRPVFGAQRCTTLEAVAISVRSTRRVLLPSERYGVTDVVAASSSPPPFALPHRLDGRLYVDAGLLSVCSVDLAPASDLLVVVAPLGGPHMNAAARMFERQTHRHIARWRSRFGGEVLYIRPNRELAAVAGRGTAGLFRADCAGPAASAAFELGRTRIAAFRRQHEQVWAAAGDAPPPAT